MLIAPYPENEPERLAALCAARILDTDPEPAFNALTEAAAAACAAPIALISLVDDRRQWFKARVGLDACETGRDVAFCAHALLQSEPLAVEDARADARFVGNPLVTGAPFIRGYLGAPIRTREGFAFGTVCVIDPEPRAWSEAHRAVLTRLADIAAALIESRTTANALSAHALRLAELQRIDARHRAVVAAMADGVLVTDGDSVIVDANPAALAILEATRERLMGLRVNSRQWDLVDADGAFLPMEAHPMARTLRERTSVGPVQIGVLTSAGERRWLRVRTGFIGEDAGGPNVISTFSDITHEKRQHDLILQAKARHDLTLELANAATFELDLKAGRFVASHTLTELFGRDVSALAVRNIWSLAHREDLRNVQRAWVRHRAGGPPVDIDLRIARTDGTLRWMRVYAAAQHDASGAAERVIGFIKDVDEPKRQALALSQALSEAQSARRATNGFLANMSHEIRTPLNGVIGIAAALAQTRLSAEQREMVELISSSSAVLERLLSDALDAAKVEAGQATLEPSAFELARELEAAVELMRARAIEKGVIVTLEIAPAARGRYFADAVRLRQIVSNLVSNAVKFTEQGHVAVRVDAAARLDPGAPTPIRIVVEDTGIGFAQSEAQRLFERFTQADGSITRRYGGTGLGLSITKSLVELFGGEIFARSEPGAGATFTVTLPLARAAAAAPIEAGLPPPTPTAAPARDLRVLLVEDHPANRRVVEILLKPFGFSVFCAANGLEGVDAWRRGRFDLVLMDMQMPVMDGLAAVRRIRSEERASGRRRTPIAMLSANSMVEHQSASIAAGADAHICKPVTAQTLLIGIERALSLAHAAAAA